MTAAHPHVRVCRTGIRAQVTDELLQGPVDKVLDKYGPFIDLCISSVTSIWPVNEIWGPVAASSSRQLRRHADNGDI